MFNTATTKPYIAKPTISPFKWGWNLNHSVPWMFHYHLRPPWQTRPMLKLKLTKPPSSLSGSSTSTIRFRIFYKSQIPSTSSTMINTRCHTSFGWEKKFVVFNVDLLWPYFPPLLDTSEIVEQLAPTYINPNYMEQASTNHIMDTQCWIMLSSMPMV
jgi:hypothetical protein